MTSAPWLTDLRTPWGEALDPDAVLPEYPRPQLVRDSHLNLNGTWEHAFTPLAVTDAPATFDGPILVPFSPEAPLSGVGRTLQPDEWLWYRREFTLPEGFCRDRVLLHFGAVDSECTVWVDEVEVGAHRGGFLPFTLDVTDALADRAEHTLVVRVRDLTDTSFTSRGKQVLDPGGIWYSAQSGIWQTVWMESVPPAWVDRIDVVPELDGAGGGSLTLTVHAGGTPQGPATVVVTDAGTEIARVRVPTGEPVRVAWADVRAWSPEDPHLYDLSVTLDDDAVTSYAAVRTVGTGPDAHGRTRLLLNGEPYLHAGLLDQGYWPDGLLTAPADEALVHDIVTAKELGFTMLRKHIKVEPLRWYHHCDRLGMLVWQDMVNGGRSYRMPVITTPVALPVSIDDSRHAVFGRGDAQGREEFVAETRATVQLLAAVPSVVLWVPFNEGWGQFDANEVADLVKELDPTRPVDHASGWHEQGGGDLASRHVYFRPYRLSRRDAEDPRAAVLSEYGGYSHRVEGHTWSTREFGYRRIADRGAFQRAFLRLQQAQVRPALAEGLAGFVYTQVSDVEEESNGLMTYDRRVLKVDVDAVRASNAALASTFTHAVGGTASPVPVTERELTAPVDLTRPDGRLNPDAVGWTRTPLLRTDGIGRGRLGRGRNKRWEYWAVTTPTHVVSLVVSDIDYAGVNGLWLLDRRTGEEITLDVITPLGRGVTLPGTLDAGPVRLQGRGLEVEITEEPDGTRLRAVSERVQLDVLARRPEGHECLGVVVPWTERLFQYTVKDVARPASGWLVADGHRVVVDEDAWATLDHGRGRWPHRVHWNWGACSGRVDGRVVGLQVGGRWTDGTGSVENSLLLGQRLHKISEELVWSYDPDAWLAPWRITGDTVDLTFTPEHVKSAGTDLVLLSSRSVQCFGTWTGQALGHPVDGLFGWAEDVHQRW